MSVCRDGSLGQGVNKSLAFVVHLVTARVLIPPNPSLKTNVVLFESEKNYKLAKTVENENVILGFCVNRVCVFLTLFGKIALIDA